jgi:hypothetical protein
VAGLKVTITGNEKKFKFTMTGNRIARTVTYARAEAPKTINIEGANGKIFWKLTFTQLVFDTTVDDEIHVKFSVQHMIDVHAEDGANGGPEFKDNYMWVEGWDRMSDEVARKCDDHGDHQDCIKGKLEIGGTSDGAGTADDIESWTLVIVGSHRGGEVKGDPHFQTWNSDYFDFHGECDLVFLNAPNFADGLGLTIHLRTKIRYAYSYVESAALRIGNSILEVGSFGGYALDGVDDANLKDPGANLGGFAILHSQFDPKRHLFEIIIDEHESIKITTFKDIVSVKILGGSSSYYANSVGMMGSFEDGTMLARDGTTVIADPNLFGQEWQVHETEPKLFRVNRSPQLPREQCRLPSTLPNVTGRRLEGSHVWREDAERACNRVGVDAVKQNCMFDGT